MLLSYKLVYYPKYIINCAPKGPGGCPVLVGGGKVGYQHKIEM